MKNCKKHFLAALVVLFLGQFLAPKAAQAQVIEVGGSIGLSYYMGDINPKKPFNSSALGWGALIRYYSNTRWAYRIAYSNLQLNGSDEASGYRPERGLSFKTKTHDISVIAEFNFFDYFTGSKRDKITPYIFGGLSLFGFEPQDSNGKCLHDLKTDVVYGTVVNEDGSTRDYEKKIDYNTTAFSIPFGIGVKYSLGAKLGVSLEWRWHYTFTDWIDDCHAYYPSNYTGNHYTPDDISHADPTGVAADPDHPEDNFSWYKQRGNKEDNDWFGYLNLSIVYKFILPGANDCKTERKNAYNTY